MRYVASRTRPVIYLTIAKAGLTSTLNALLWLDQGRFADDPEDIHRHVGDLFVTAANAPETLERRLKTDKVFTVVRDPLRRAWSLFNDKALHEHPHAFPFLRRRLLRKGAALDPQAGIEPLREDFLLFLRAVRADVNAARGRPAKINPHWRPQSLTLRQAARKRAPDVVCRTETLDADLPAVLRWAGVEDPPPPRRFNEGPPSPHPPAQVLDHPDVHALAATIFARDYAMLGYPIPGASGDSLS